LVLSRRLLNAACCCAIVLAPLTALAATQAQAAAPQPGLAIVDAGVQNEEDGPFVPPDYTFLPGHYLYFTFQISGYKVKGDEYNGPREISLAYKIQVLDAKGVPLVKEQADKIAQEVGSEDKDWLPKKRFSSLLPPLIGAGTYHLHLVVQDVLAKSEAAADFSFLLGGKKVESAAAIHVQDFRFLRSDQDGQGLDIAAFRPGDTVWARFDMTGFKSGADNSVDLAYGVSVLRPDGRVLFAQANAAEQKRDASFYPPQFVPGVLSVTTTRDLPRGEYTMVVAVHDRVGETSTEIRQKFRIE
jgi:hypothetical protein